MTRACAGSCKLHSLHTQTLPQSSLAKTWCSEHLHKTICRVSQATAVVPNKLLDTLLAVLRQGCISACNCPVGHRRNPAATPAAVISQCLQPWKACPLEPGPGSNSRGIRHACSCTCSYCVASVTWNESQGTAHHALPSGRSSQAMPQAALASGISGYICIVMVATAKARQR